MGQNRVETGRGRGTGVVKPTPGKGTPGKGTPAKGKNRTAAARRTKNSTRIFYLALAVIAVAGIGALTWISRGGAATERAASPIDSTLPKVQSNGYVIGAASAPIEVTEFG